MITRRQLFPAVLAPAFISAVPIFGQTVPRPVDALLINTLAGPKLDIKTLRGKVFAVELLLTTCSHCQASARVLQELYTELKPKGFEVVGAAVDVPDAAKVADAKVMIDKFTAITGAKFPIGWISQGQVLGFLQFPAGRNLFMPQLVLVDRKGNIVYQHEGEADAAALRAEITKHLAVPAPRAARAKKG